MPSFSALKPPASGSPISRRTGQVAVPDDPIIPFIEGDGTGPDTWRASSRVFFDAARRAPKYAGDAAAVIEQGLGKTIIRKKVTYDLARQMRERPHSRCPSSSTPSSPTCSQARLVEEHR